MTDRTGISALRHTAGFNIPDPPVDMSEDHKRYFNEIKRSLRFAFDHIYHDLSKGKARHQVFTKTIVDGDLDDGEIALEDVGGTRKIVTYISGTKRSVEIT